MLRKLFCNGCRCDDVMEEIRKMDLSRSLLHEIPRSVFYCERTLEQLYLDSNHISELPRQLFNCDELRVLSLMDNDISFIPPAISTLVHLEKLNLCKNSVCDVPENIKFCMSLTFLDLSVNPLERFPEHIINLTALQELYLNDTYLEYLPANFGKLVSLRLLELRENSLNALPKTMCRLTHLTRLDIGNNEFTELPEVVSALHNLTELWIDGNRIRRLPPQIAQLRKMIHFEAGNNLIESLPRDIGYWTRVVEFAVSNNDICAIPTTIGNMKNLVGLKLDENNMKALPDTIGKLTNLEDLMLSHNFLTHLPSSIGLLRKLRVLTVDKNYLRDIPSELGSCTSVTTLSLRGNRITEVPAEIGHMTNLRVLNLVDNHLKHLPMSLLKLNNLGALWLSNNQSQPLVPLQQERTPDQNQTVLTCFMLPQLKKSGRPEVVADSDFGHKPTPNNRHICFASDAGLPEQRSRLTRAPTPYPKELRAMSKHAKTVQRGLTVLPPKDQGESSRNTSSSPIQIKEAKVATTSPSSECKPITATKQRTKHSDTGDAIRPDKPLALDFYYDIEPTKPIDIPPKVFKCESTNPQIREAKNIRTDIQTLPHILNIPTQLQIPQLLDYSDHGSGDHEALQPPPYHIAAAYSRQAQFFNSENQSRRSPSPVVPPRLQLKRSDIQNGGHPPAKIAHVAGAAYHQIGRVAHFELALNNMIQSFGNLSITEMYGDDDRSSSPRRFIQDVPEPSQHIVAPTPKRPHSGDNLRMPTNDVSRHGISKPLCNGTELENTYAEGLQIGTKVKKAKAHGTIDNQSENGAPESTRLLHNSPMYKAVERNQSGIYSSMASTGLDSTTKTGKQQDTLYKWMFGNHKNATVMQVIVICKPDLSIELTTKWGKGIYVESVFGCEQLLPGDKILECDGVDFSKMTKTEAKQYFRTRFSNSSVALSMMISRIK